MASLRNTKSKHSFVLRTQHIFGRHSAGSHTVLENPEASRLHASILWNGAYWILQDTSSNGTFLNGQSVSTGIKSRLKLGDKIQFGAMDAPTWVFNNDQPPKSLLVPLIDGLSPIELTGVVVLPNEASPDIILYQNDTGHWVVEDESGAVRLEAGHKVSTAQSSWVFIDAETADNTRQAEHVLHQGLTVYGIKFDVSKDEEHVCVTLKRGEMTIDLGERVHHYLILFLARKRLKDSKHGVESSEQGWIDKSSLTQQTGWDEKHINLHIFRFRKQLIEVNPNALQLLQMVEKRRGSLRLALTAIEINGGNDFMNQS